MLWSSKINYDLKTVKIADLVAVKVVSKFVPVREKDQGPVAVPAELKNLCALNGCANIVELLSWTETTFDLQLVFPRYAEDAFAALQRGHFKVHLDGCDPLKTTSKELLVGLSHMHAMQIIHRDLKPSNMLMKTNGGMLLATVIADLGS